MKASLLPLLLLAAITPAKSQKIKPTSAPRQKPALKRLIPKAVWEPLFFEAINERAKASNLAKLRTTVLPDDDIEARVWIGFGLVPLEGFILRRRSGRWEGIHLRSIHPQLARTYYQKPLAAPKSGWEPFWNRLVKLGLLRLPDSSTLKREKSFHDGTSYVVEINKNGTYRTYLYANPDEQRWPEAKQILKIANSIYSEFGIR